MAQDGTPQKACSDQRPNRVPAVEMARPRHQANDQTACKAELNETTNYLVLTVTGGLENNLRANAWKLQLDERELFIFEL